MKIMLTAALDKPSIDFLVSNARYWLSPIEGQFVAVWVGNDNDEQSYNYTIADLALHHPLLPKIITGILNFDKERKGNLHAPGVCVDASIKLLDALFTVTDYWGGTAHIMHVRSIKRSPSGTNVDIHCERIYSELAVVDGQEVRLATNGAFGAVNVPVPVADLDTRYPGWNERLALCDAIDTTNATAMRFVFQERPLTPEVTALPTSGLST